MKNTLRKHYIIAFWLTLTISLSLIVGGFFCPPIGEIDGSVLSAVGEIFLYPALALAAKALADGKDVTFGKGEMKVTVGDNDKHKNDEENGDS